MKTLDVTGLSCPEPVVRTMAALKDLAAGESINVLADTATARDNVIRVAGNMAFRLSRQCRHKLAQAA